ncbi:hypothetical protein [Encephalitozoon cuniculi GB-M1]|uniref:Signal peptidase subunit 3 n=2 Tax=Encephalitozoon cuniculi TaxID=6035 RepID=Q8STR9_ENCCU|nr:uncharacterized protein ECU09_0960 [Encephalitozoon cuniculi GB-M1]AGE96463.1 hypothetical protein [Encephalitozoon cuniculi]KMV65460.1 hypothetical protein M970_090980 [Encephalitozoon cuniculi EcunIII-L]UYI26784.1 signal peptidase subunit [Encephalitozoon cuniculi]CAD27069.1 hypothetical protein [Encephalitozoon cuniculi GB-M1]
MKTAGRRLSALVSFTFSPTVILLLAVFLFSFFVTKAPPASSLRIREYKAYGKTQVVLFEPSIDLSSQFHFNLKQIFVYVRVLYGGRSDRSEVIWSRIIGWSDAKRLTGVFRSTYDIAGDLTDSPCFELRGCYFPRVGWIRDILFCKTDVRV